MYIFNYHADSRHTQTHTPVCRIECVIVDSEIVNTINYESNMVYLGCRSIECSREILTIAM